MKDAEHELEHRKPLWNALSCFYLDNNDLEHDAHINGIARVCADSPYSEGELTQIMFTEVWPALVENLYSTAGEWAGFDSDWLMERILKMRRQRLHFPWWFNPERLLYCRQWFSVLKRVRIHRLQSAKKPLNARRAEEPRAH
jgi:hypothetical protein